MAQLNLYYQTQLVTKVSVLPEQLNGNLDNHILENLKMKIEGRVIDEGIVLHVNKLINYDYGMIDKSNFMGTTVYQVIYECFICSPIKDLEIICVIDNIVKGFLIGRNGPIRVAIQFNNIDNSKFEINDNTIYSKAKRAVQKGDHLKVAIISIKHDLGEKHIMAMCKLLDFADKNEIRKFNDEQASVTGNTGDKEFI